MHKLLLFNKGQSITREEEVMVTFQEMLASFTGRTVEVFVPNAVIEGTLQSVTSTFIVVEESPTTYGPGATLNIPISSIISVRVLV